MVRAHNRTYQRTKGETNQIIDAFQRIRPKSNNPNNNDDQQLRPQSSQYYPDYTIVRRLSSPDTEAQLNLLVRLGSILLDFPQMHAARIRKAGDIMVPLLKDLHLQAITENGYKGANLKILLENACAKTVNRTEDKVEATVRGWRVGRTGNFPAPCFHTKLRSSGMRHSLVGVGHTLEELTGISLSLGNDKKSLENYSLHLGEFVVPYPSQAKEMVEIAAATQWPNGMHVTFGPMEVVDLRKDAERYLSIGALANLT